jgi:hypothetical protein
MAHEEVQRTGFRTALDDESSHVLRNLDESPPARLDRQHRCRNHVGRDGGDRRQFAAHNGLRRG